MSKVVFLGLICVDSVHLVSSPMKLTGFHKIKESALCVGGPAAISALYSKKMGLSTSLVSNKIGTDIFGQGLERFLKSGDLDYYCTPVEKSVVTPHCILLSDPIGNKLGVASDEQRIFPGIDEIDPSIFDDCELVSVDCFFEAQIHEILQKYVIPRNIPIIGMDLLEDSPNIDHVTYMTLSSSFEEFDDEALEEYAEYLFSKKCEIFIYSEGEKGGRVFVKGKKEPHRFNPFRGEICDTTGAGDSFRAGLVYSFINKQDIFDSITFAAHQGYRSCLYMGSGNYIG